MNSSSIGVFVAVAAVLAFRLYQKYGKKNLKDGSHFGEDSKNSPLTRSSKDDDYEPYSKK